MQEALEVVASIENSLNPLQVVDICYLREENLFVTQGIREHFGRKEIRIGARLMVTDFELMGTILAAVLERLSVAQEAGVEFAYAPAFTVLGREYFLTEEGDCMVLSRQEEGVPVPRREETWGP